MKIAGCPLELRLGVDRMPSEPSVTIIVPVLNEEKYIRGAITSLIPAGNNLDYELIVLDGGSTDRTLGIVTEMAALNSRIRLEPNPARYQSAAVNSGAKIAKPESNIIVRADSHAEYPPDFVAGLVRELQERDVASVVVPMRTRGRGFLQRGIAVAQNSRLGNGGALHRSANTSRYVEHGHHAAFDRKAFLAVGGYDESFTHNEDAELDIRLSNSGARIWLCSELGIAYFPRGSFAGLARQYFNHGSGRARTMFKHRRIPKVRQLLPLATLAMNVLSLGSGLAFGWPFFLPALAYIGACMTWGAYLSVSERDPAGWAGGLAAMIMHQSWAAGFAYRALRIAASKATLR
jgi:succinoglycan biosynthesis protein ExoA